MKTHTQRPTTSTMRCAPVTGSWLFAMAEATGKSVNEIAGGMVALLRQWMGLGEALAAVLEQRARVLGLSQRRYIIDLFQRRAAVLQKEGVGTQRGSPAVALAKRAGMTAEDQV